MRVKAGIAIGLVLVGFASIASAEELNFCRQTTKKGCDSIITERGQQECDRAQREKNDKCNVSASCDVSDQERLISKYKDAKERLDRGQVNDADKDKLRDNVRLMKDQLDANKEAARRAAQQADDCVKARKDVQKWFADVGVPLTERTRDGLMRDRKDLLDKLEDGLRKQRDAKSKRDASPNDSSAQSDYDRASETVRDVERRLREFKERYGEDIDVCASRLLRHYDEERERHKQPIEEAENRREKCRKLDNMSY